MKTLNNNRNMTIFAFVILVVALSLLLWKLLSMSWDNMDFWLKIASGILAGLTFIVGIGAIISGYYLGERQAETIRSLERNNLELQSRVEQERLTRLQLEESLEPRILTVTGTTTDKLKEFAGTPFVIEAVSDGEVLRAAGQIRFALTTAGWNDLGLVLTGSEPDGVRLETIFPDETSESQFSPATNTLLIYLEANGWEARTGGYVKRLDSPLEQKRKSGEIPNGAVKIRIGIKPAPYFMGKLIEGAVNKQSKNNFEEFRRQEKERREQLRQEWNLPPRSP